MCGPALHLLHRHRHVWVRYIDTTKITVWCMSSLLLSIDLRWLCYFIMFYFKLTNGAIAKWWIVKWCNGEIKIRICPLVSNRYRICLFILFPNKTFLQQTKKSIIFNFWSLRTSTATKLCYQTKQPLKYRTLSGVSQSLWGIFWLWFKSSCFRNLWQSTNVTNQC